MAKYLSYPIFSLLFLPLFIGHNNFKAYASSNNANEGGKLEVKTITQEPEIQKDEYILGPGDQVLLTIFDLPEMSGVFTIMSDGTLPIALLGNVSVEGMTLNQANDFLVTALSKELLRPSLQISVTNPRPIRYAIYGEIEKPGVYSISNSDSSSIKGETIQFSGIPTIVDAIQKSGGVTSIANLRSVVVDRRLPGRELNYKRTNLDLLKLILEGDISQDIYLFDGDKIKVSKATEIPNEAIEIATANLSPKIINVNIIGEVHTPGRIEINSRTPLNQAILQAGGPIDWRASTGNVELIRVNRNGSATLKRYKIDLTQSVSNEDNPPLKDGDTIKVKSNAIANISNGLGVIGDPIGKVVNILSLYRLLGSD